MRRIWPGFVIGVGDEVWVTAKMLPCKFAGRLSTGFIVSRDYAMQKHSDEHGFVLDATGQSSIAVWIVGNKDAGCHIDLVLPERPPNAFASLVLREFFVAIALGYRVTLARDCGMGECLLTLDHPMAPDWSANALAVCRELCVGEGVERDFEVWSETSPDSPVGTRLRARFGPGATRRDVHLGTCILAEVVGCWHTVKYCDMKQRVAYACPPGKVVIREGCIDFEGSGCIYPF